MAAVSAEATGLTLDPELEARLHRLERASALRLLIFAALYLSAAGGAVRLVETALELSEGSPRLVWLLGAAPLILIAAAALHGISLFTHEAVHGVLAGRRWINDWLGAACAWPVLQNFHAYRVLHLRHHKHLGEPGDPDHYANYTRWTWLITIMNWTRLAVGYPVYITLIPILGWRRGKAGDRWRIAVEVAATVMLAGLAIKLLPPLWLVVGWLAPMLAINTMVNIRGMSQHTLLRDPTHPIRGTRTILTNPITRFFMCNENYHLEHHLYPRVPWYHLPRLHAELRPQLEAEQAPFISSYLSFVGEFLRESWRRSPLGRVA